MRSTSVGRVPRTERDKWPHLTRVLDLLTMLDARLWSTCLGAQRSLCAEAYPNVTGPFRRRMKSHSSVVVALIDTHPVCAENLVRIALVTESRNVGDDGRAALFSF